MEIKKCLFCKTDPEYGNTKLCKKCYFLNDIRPIKWEAMLFIDYNNKLDLKDFIKIRDDIYKTEEKKLLILKIKRDKKLIEIGKELKKKYKIKD